MKHLCTLLLCAGLAAQHDPNLEPVAFLAGEFVGQGAHSLGKYGETLTGEWRVGGSILVVESRSMMGDQVVFEDHRVFSYDAERKVIRMRQWALGDLAIYDVVVEDGRVRCVETAHEGKSRNQWRYTFVPADDGFEYSVHEARGPVFGEYVSGSLRRKLPDPSEQGPLGRRSENAKLAGLDAEIWIPEGDGPFPTVVFSPGGGARTTRGYAPFARWFASWGYATVIVAFAERDSSKCAALFGKVLDELPENLDRERVAAAGHSLGGAAAVLAARLDDRFDACLALAPSGPAHAAGGPPTLVIVGGKDQYHDDATKLFSTLGAPRYLVDIETMDHGFGPPDDGMKVLARATSFLHVHLGGNARYLELLLREKPGTKVEHAAK